MSVRAKVTITLDVYLDQPWSDTETVGNVRAAATRDATEAVSIMINTGQRSGARIFLRGKPQVGLITEGEDAAQVGPKVYSTDGQP